MKTDAVELTLTCGSWQEAQNITDALLASKLVACVEQLEVRSQYWWQGAIEDAKEIKLVMTSLASKFEEVEAEVRKHHSYETIVLHMLPITHLNADARDWLTDIVAS
ncbi:MAG: divalent-cation tolerance protein CutA [Candidatus Saccharimonadales bacterium]